MVDVIKTRGTTPHAVDRLLPFEDFHMVIQLKEYFVLDELYKAADLSE